MRVQVVAEPDGRIVSLTVVAETPETSPLRRSVPGVEGKQVTYELELSDRLTRCRLVDVVQDYRIDKSGKRPHLVPWREAAP